MLFGGKLLTLSQCSYTFVHKNYALLLFCYAFCKLAICTAFSILFISLFTSIFGHSHLKCPTSQYLKCFYFSFSSYHSTFLNPLTPYSITLLTNTLNLFFSFVTSSILLLLLPQLWARYPNFLQPQHSCSFLLSSSSLVFISVLLVKHTTQKFVVLLY